jgi:LPS sulfotransferase NodH
VSAPVVILGVSRSGTTLLKEMLDRHSQLAIPSESYFIPQLWHRHGTEVEREAFVADLARLERIAEWGVDPAEVGARLGQRSPFHEAVQAIYRCYADARGKSRFGDKTPLYMQQLEVLDRAFPEAQYVHIVRDGRDACVSFLQMQRRPRFNWARPRGVAGFAAQWRREVEGARRFAARRAGGRYLELPYEQLVAEPRSRLAEVCAFLGLEFEEGMLEYHRDVDRTRLVDHPLLGEPPKSARSRWREDMAPGDVRRFEAIAGDLLDALGYERAGRSRSRGRVRATVDRAAYAARVVTFNGAVSLVRRSPVWRARQVYVRRTASR